MGRLDGKVAFVSGAARGQGRSHAVRFAEEGADIIAIDVCRQVDTVPYGMSASEDLAETARLVEALDRRIVIDEVDVRDAGAVAKALDEGVRELGRLDIVVANAGIFSVGDPFTMTEQVWKDMIDINLTGVWNTVQPALRHLVSQGTGGAIVMVSSAAALKPSTNLAHYAAAKAGVVGMMHALSNDLGQYGIRVNTVHPTLVNTPMGNNEIMHRLFLPDLDAPTEQDFAQASQGIQALPIPWVEPVDISNGILYLVCDEGRYVTGHTLRVDAGVVTKHQ